MPDIKNDNPVSGGLTDGRNESDRKDFDRKIRTLHELFMQGEFSQAFMAAELGIARIDLIHLLETMGLPVTNV